MRRSQLIDTLHAMASEMDVPGYDWDMLLAEKTSHLSDLHVWLSEFYAYWLVERHDVQVYTTPFARLYAVYVNGREAGCITDSERGYQAYRCLDDGDYPLGDPTDDMDDAAVRVMLAVS